MCGSRIYDRALKWRLHPIPSRERDGWEPKPWLDGSRRFRAIEISSWSARDRTKRRAPVWRWPSGERASAGSGPCSAAWTPGSSVSIPSSGSGPSVRPTSPPDPDGPTLADKGHRGVPRGQASLILVAGRIDLRHLPRRCVRVMGARSHGARGDWQPGQGRRRVDRSPALR
jgi:hypothetical protein